MAEAKVIFDEDQLKPGSGIQELYSRLLQGMVDANKVDAPSFNPPPLTPEGTIDAEAIQKAMAEYSTILMKNSAYFFS